MIDAENKIQTVPLYECWPAENEASSLNISILTVICSVLNGPSPVRRQYVRDRTSGVTILVNSNTKLLYTCKRVDQKRDKAWRKVEQRIIGDH